MTDTDEYFDKWTAASKRIRELEAALDEAPSRDRLNELEAELAVTTERANKLASQIAQESHPFAWHEAINILKARAEKAEALVVDAKKVLANLRSQILVLMSQNRRFEARVAELAPEMWTFFREMTRKFRLHDKDRGDSWKQDGWPWVTRLREELEEAIAVDALPDEWADVANYAFFAWWHCFWHSPQDALNRRA